jgi:Alpha/beta hydrolase domain
MRACADPFYRRRPGALRGATSALSIVASAALAVVSAGSPPASAASTAVEVEGPIGGGARGRPFTSATFDLGAVGFVEEEYFVSGVAATWGPAPGTALSRDGRWQVVATGAEPYRTRILVRRPRDARRFNGTVVVEWQNVSGGWDIDAVWAQIHTELVRSGYAWVGVSAQRAGVNGPPVLPGVSQPLTTWDPDRYGSLAIADDALSYDIFTQAAHVLGPDRPRAGVDPLAGLAVHRLIATGASQSAHRLASYVDAVHRLAGAYDGFLIVGRFGRGADLAPGAETPDVLLLRTDLGVPILAVNTETEALASFPARQPDSPTYRYWEVAGGAHQGAYVDATIDAQIRRDLGFELPACDPPGNTMPVHYVLNAALDHLDRWVAGQGRATRLPLLATGPGGAGGGSRSEAALGSPSAAPPRFAPISVSGTPPEIERDESGNARGGIRLPDLVVPTAQYGPVGMPEELRCDLRGFTIPFAPATLAGLYPSHDAYVRRVGVAALRAVRSGFLLPADGLEVVRMAASAAIP